MPARLFRRVDAAGPLRRLSPAVPLSQLRRRPPQAHPFPAINPSGQFSDGSVPGWVDQLLVQLRQRYQSEGPLVKQGVGYLKVWVVDYDVAVKENVHVNEARAVAQARPAAHVALHRLDPRQ
jgi:hypothetical protein